MSGRRLVVAAAAAVMAWSAAGGCQLAPCVRHSDCGTAWVCEAGACVQPASPEDTEGGSGSSDGTAATQAASGAPPDAAGSDGDTADDRSELDVPRRRPAAPGPDEDPEGSDDLGESDTSGDGTAADSTHGGDASTGYAAEAAYG